MTVTDQTPADKFLWVGHMETVSGRTFNIIEPTPDQVHLEDVATALANICRYNGHVPSHYSVAEHSVRVSWHVASATNSPYLALTGLLHDAAEAYVGDMIRPLKRHPEFGAYHQEIEGRVADAIAAALGGDYPYPEIIHEADQATYRWEVANIRSGIEDGWTAPQAKSQFLHLYEVLHSLVLGGNL